MYQLHFRDFEQGSRRSYISLCYDWPVGGRIIEEYIIDKWVEQPGTELKILARRLLESPGKVLVKGIK